MTRTVYYCAATLDGFIADPDDGIGWLTGYEGRFDSAGTEPMEGSYDRFYEGIGALVMGSVTYEWVLEHGGGWPYGGKPAWVLSSRNLPLPQGAEADVRVLAADVGELHEEVAAAAGGRDVWIVGGGDVASQFADHGLLDALVVTVVPVVLGAGKPLFARRVEGGPMRLAGTRSFDNGMAELRYEIDATRLNR